MLCFVSNEFLVLNIFRYLGSFRSILLDLEISNAVLIFINTDFNIQKVLYMVLLYSVMIIILQHNHRIIFCIFIVMVDK